MTASCARIAATHDFIVELITDQRLIQPLGAEIMAYRRARLAVYEARLRRSDHCP